MRLEVRTNITLRELDAVFTRHGRDVAIVHYAGHAGPDHLLLESASGESKAAHAGGLARILGLQEGLQLVFLNGCSTGPQVLALSEAGVDAVVATSRPIDDAAARQFAVAFYTQLAAGRAFRDAFDLAAARLTAEHGDNPRDFLAGNDGVDTIDVSDDRGFPWKLYIRDGAGPVAQETLSRLAGRPLLGLPPLAPPGWLPPSPFRHLQRFTRDEAHLFFGRGQEIADLYERVTSSSPRRVILYSGPTGVGKSSVLDAGLMPRLAATREVIYLRRDASLGLLGTLRSGLTRPGETPAADVSALSRARETPTRPLVVNLDQAEETFTRPRPGVAPAHELVELVRALKEAFEGRDTAPAGRLILSFRKEWLQEFERSFDEARFGYESIKLRPLDYGGIIEAIEGPTRDPELRGHYELTVEPGLANRIAVELEHDAGAALAPTLQVLLTKMWTAAGGKGAAFTSSLYNRPILLNEVLDEGLKSLKDWRPDVVESGFALDLLEYHTTPLGTSETRTRDELAARYPGRVDVLDECLRLCEASYLLIPAETGSSAAKRLGHDTLAPMVREHFQLSAADGQRHRRLLENRAGVEGRRMRNTPRPYRPGDRRAGPRGHARADRRRAPPDRCQPRGPGPARESRGPKQDGPAGRSDGLRRSLSDPVRYDVLGLARPGSRHAKNGRGLDAGRVQRPGAGAYVRGHAPVSTVGCHTLFRCESPVE